MSFKTLRQLCVLFVCYGQVVVAHAVGVIQAVCTSQDCLAAMKSGIMLTDSGNSLRELGILQGLS